MYGGVVTMIFLSKLDIIAKDEFIHCGIHVKGAFPRDVVWMENGDFFHYDL
jgi:hypothetical protein